ncbi:UDP-glucose:dolichyl-phosphate glucosyltransferase [candidate division WWE3 bacterium CG08_land_8_20_14_0_20_41_15]|uniref:UDP-glucose:dolichyl-phosphate glucosyltransferase n=1 Tax=candidate division WWE3 bacterium CG08_land_8_20_14_0_20_41_15 TaxID=1975086 RepID=A0A2H0X9X6_UNCKA|nr:MAG: UDP-glucose:dolichyl-phosphate glucosyltransferase [candidate division WWE3 bacterium CG08_land_8_20_14_0_20_41_15]
MQVSIVIPAYKQAKTIVKDLERVKNALEELKEDYEIIVVCDGTLDNTFEEAGKLKSTKIKVYGYEGANRGKGYALRYGTARATGELICFLDSGMEINPKGISLLLEKLRWNDDDIVIASKLHPESKVNYPLQRRITTHGYRFLIRLLFGLRIKDTQTGLKLFKRKVLEKVMPRLLVKAYAIDIEILALAHHFGFTKIEEAPVEVTYNFGDLTHAANLKPILRMIQDTLAVFYRLKILRYYDDNNKRKWTYDKELEMRINTP